MAKTKLGATLADARNAAGGIVYSKNQFGSYIRQKVSPVQPRSTHQMAARARLQDLATRWANTLTDAQRAAWIALAAANPVIDVFGDSQVLTGLQFYVRVNRNIIAAGGTRIDAAPANQNVTALLTLSLTADVSDNKINVTFTPTPLGASEKLVIYATPPLSSGRAFAQNFLKYIYASAAAQVSPVDVTNEWRTRYGDFQAAQRITIEACILNSTNGAASATLQATCIVTA